ncbi:MAG: hypothetical protein ACTTHG_05240 [Treponemataceae bacterium]
MENNIAVCIVMETEISHRRKFFLSILSFSIYSSFEQENDLHCSANH